MEVEKKVIEESPKKEAVRAPKLPSPTESPIKEIEEEVVVPALPTPTESPMEEELPKEEKESPKKEEKVSPKLEEKNAEKPQTEKKPTEGAAPKAGRSRARKVE